VPIRLNEIKSIVQHERDDTQWNPGIVGTGRQIQNLMAAQYRAEALDQARKAEAEQAARSATDRFLGPGHAYTPR